MDSYKRKIIKAGEIVDSGKSIPLSRSVKKVPLPHEATGKLKQNMSAEKAQTAQTPAEPTTALTQKQIKTISDEAYAKGFADGQKSQHKDVAAALESLAQVIKSIPSIKKNILEKGEEQMVRLAVAIAEKVIQQEVATRKDIIFSVLKNALKNIAETEGMKIRLNTQDFRYMMEVKKDFLQSFDGIRNVVFEEDPSVKRGGAVVETLFGEVDARLESQIKEIKSALIGAK
jgi:flagellar assembly protein FliH